MLRGTKRREIDTKGMKIQNKMLVTRKLKQTDAKGSEDVANSSNDADD
jgi:hypothetical protein